MVVPACAFQVYDSSAHTSGVSASANQTPSQPKARMQDPSWCWSPKVRYTACMRSSNLQPQSRLLKAVSLCGHAATADTHLPTTHLKRLNCWLPSSAQSMSVQRCPRCLVPPSYTCATQGNLAGRTFPLKSVAFRTSGGDDCKSVCDCSERLEDDNKEQPAPNRHALPSNDVSKRTGQTRTQRQIPHDASWRTRPPLRCAFSQLRHTFVDSAEPLVHLRSYGLSQHEVRTKSRVHIGRDQQPGLSGFLCARESSTDASSNVTAHMRAHTC